MFVVHRFMTCCIIRASGCQLEIQELLFTPTSGTLVHTLHNTVHIHVKIIDDAFLPYICRYKSLPELMSQVCDVHHKWRLLTKQNERLKKKIATVADKAEVTVNEELHNDMIAFANEN